MVAASGPGTVVKETYRRGPSCPLLPVRLVPGRPDGPPLHAGALQKELSQIRSLDASVSSRLLP